MAMGRPLKWETVEEVQVLIDNYFKQCDKDKEPYTITGLALALDTSRETLCNYSKRENFFDTIRRAKGKVALEYEKRLVTRGNAGDIFANKNFGWTDKQTIEHEGTVSLGSVLADLDNEALRASETE